MVVRIRRSQRSVERAVGERIRALREKQALTQAALARLAGTSQSNLARIENGDRSATLGSLSRVAKALRVPLADLVTDGVSQAKPARAEKLWYRICDRLRDEDEAFLLGVEHLVRALDRARSL